MKQLTLFLLLVSTLLANPLQGVDASFSKDVQKQLLQKLNSEHSSPLYPKNRYTLSKGWNRLTTPKDGVDVIKTFQNIPEVKLVILHDNASKYWAGFTLYQEVLKDIKEMLLLKYLEPNVTFFVLSEKAMMFEIQSAKMSETCQEILHDNKYEMLHDSGLTKEKAQSEDKSISINSRYHSHEYRGFYNDTRVTLMYKKIAKTSKKILRYGPAEPMVMLNYAQEYANQKFFVYDYLEKKCYQGIFPSLKMPPLPVLQELKDTN